MNRDLFQAHNAGVAAFCLLTYGNESFVRAEYFGPKDVRMYFNIPERSELTRYFRARDVAWEIINEVMRQNEESSRTDQYANK